MDADKTGQIGWNRMTDERIPKQELSYTLKELRQRGRPWKRWNVFVKSEQV
jgi:hypothetical protein